MEITMKIITIISGFIALITLIINFWNSYLIKRFLLKKIIKKIWKIKYKNKKEFDSREVTQFKYLGDKIRLNFMKTSIKSASQKSLIKFYWFKKTWYFSFTNHNKNKYKDDLEKELNGGKVIWVYFSKPLLSSFKIELKHIHKNLVHLVEEINKKY